MTVFRYYRRHQRTKLLVLKSIINVRTQLLPSTEIQILKKDVPIPIKTISWAKLVCIHLIGT